MNKLCKQQQDPVLASDACRPETGDGLNGVSSWGHWAETRSGVSVRGTQLTGRAVASPEEDPKVGSAEAGDIQTLVGNEAVG